MFNVSCPCPSFVIGRVCQDYDVCDDCHKSGKVVKQHTAEHEMTVTEPTS